MRIREPRTVSATDLGTIVHSNPAPSTRRRHMAWATVPLTQADGYRAGDPITVLNPGTGRNERAQVEADWCVGYAGGLQRVVRLTYPAIWQPSNSEQAVEVRASASGVLEQFFIRPNVEQALINVGIQFFAGPKTTHYVELKAPGAALPAPSFSGTRSRIYQWFGRIYQPAHTPALETQLALHFEVEVFHDEDYCEMRSIFSVCDPRLDQPNGYERAAQADGDTEIGIDFIIANQNVCQPVPWDPEQSQVSLTWLGDRWRWVQDARLYYAGQPMNNVLPWGTAGRAAGVLLCKGETGTLNDQLRDDSLAAWVAWPHAIMGISEMWTQKQDAYGGAGAIPRMFKRHEHFDMNRDRAYVRSRLHQQATNLLQSAPNGGRAYLWDRGPSAVSLFHQNYGATATGDHGSWQKIPHWPAMAYRVPDLGVLAERYIRSSFGGPHYFIEANGTLVDAFTHPTLHIDRLSPGLQSGQGDMLGKTSLQTWRTTQANWMIRSPVTIAGEVGPPIESQADSHFENPWPFAQAAIFGSRTAREIARALTYTGIFGEWADTSWTEGQTGQPRAMMRGLTNHGWAAWVFGADTRVADRCLDILRDHYIEPAKAELGLPPGRLVKTLNVLNAVPGSGPDRVELRNWKNFRPWEDAHGIVGMIGIRRLLHHQRDMTYFGTMARDTAVDILRYGSPRVVDANGRIVFTFLRPSANGAPPSVYEPAAAAALADNTGMRQLTEAEMADNNWSRCLMVEGNCQASNDGFMRLGVPGSGTGSFTMGVASYAADLDGAVGDLPLVRYVANIHTGRASNPNNIPLAEWLWLISSMKWPVAMEYVWFASRTTSRGTINQQPNGCAMHSNGIDLWVTLPNSESIRRVTIATGAAQSYSPSLQTDWTGVASQGTTVAFLDGYDPGLSRTNYRVHVCTEQIVGGSTVTFTFQDGERRNVQGITYDPHSGGWLVGAHRLGVTTVWRVPIGGGVAVRETNLILHEDADPGIESISVLEDGRIIAYSTAVGRVWAHARASGGYWGPPRSQADRGAWGCFTRHAREDDALRYVSMDATGRITETEI